MIMDWGFFVKVEQVYQGILSCQIKIRFIGCQDFDKEKEDSIEKQKGCQMFLKYVKEQVVNSMGGVEGLVQ